MTTVVGLLFEYWSRGETVVGGWRFTLWCNWTMPAGESVAVFLPSCRKSQPKTELTSVIFRSYHEIYDVAGWVCRQVKDDRAAAHMAIFDIGIITRSWINIDGDELSAVRTVNDAFVEYHHRRICLVGA